MNVVTLDIETIGPLARVWGYRDQFINLNQVIEQSRVLGFGAKPLGKPVEWRSEFHDGREAMVQRAWETLDAADIVVGWNSTPFDVPWLKREFAVAGMNPPSPFLEVDLIKTVRKQFRFESNKLDNISRQFGLSGKLSHTGMSMWLGCLDGDPKAWNLMRRYCKQDVALTEELYLKLRPWITNHPSVNFTPGVCPTCGSTDTQKRGEYKSKLATYQRFQCQACGSWSKSRKAEGFADLRSAG